MKTNILSTLCALFIGVLASGQGSLIVKGKVLPIGNTNPALEILVNGTDVHKVPLSKSGKFHVNLYENDHYVFSFTQPGCIEKTVIIDTSMPQNEVPVGKLLFDVAMEPISKLEPEAIICARYTYSRDENTFVYGVPPTAVIGVAENDE